MHVAASNPIAINSNDIKKEILDKEQELVTEELKNSGKSEDIAYGALYLASKESGFITGHTIHINGGMLMI